MLNGDPRDGFFYATLTLMIYSMSHFLCVLTEILFDCGDTKDLGQFPIQSAQILTACG